jgi:hypothetical protein
MKKSFNKTLGASLLLIGFASQFFSFSAQADNWVDTIKTDAASGIQIKLSYVPVIAEEGGAKVQKTQEAWINLLPPATGGSDFFCAQGMGKVYAMVGSALEFQAIELQRFEDSNSSCHFAAKLAPLTIQINNCGRSGCEWSKVQLPVLVHFGAYWLSPQKLDRLPESPPVFRFDM